MPDSGLTVSTLTSNFAAAHNIRYGTSGACVLTSAGTHSRQLGCVTEPIRLALGVGTAQEAQELETFYVVQSVQEDDLLDVLPGNSAMAPFAAHETPPATRTLVSYR